jgi:hypothetical protein
MTTLIKIYDKTCDVCLQLEGLDTAYAEEEGLSFKSYTLEELATLDSAVRDYVVSYYVVPNNGMIDVPIYLIESDLGHVQASGVVTEFEEIRNLTTAWKQWASSQNAKSAE